MFLLYHVSQKKQYCDIKLIRFNLKIPKKAPVRGAFFGIMRTLTTIFYAKKKNFVDFRIFKTVKNYFPLTIGFNDTFAP